MRRTFPYLFNDTRSDTSYILNGDQGHLAIRAKGEAVAHIVHEADQIARRLHEVGQEADTLGALAVEQLEQLRDLDNAARADDADPEGLGDGQLEADRVGDVDVVHERPIARVA